MTPLEEIEQAIADIKTAIADDPDPGPGNWILAGLYTARGIERLEATVRMIGVILQERLPQPEPFPNRIEVEAVAVETPEDYEREYLQQLAEHPPGSCVHCGKALGEQHSPHCPRQGKVSVDSLR